MMLAGIKVFTPYPNQINFLGLFLKVCEENRIGSSEEKSKRSRAPGMFVVKLDLARGISAGLSLKGCSQKGHVR